MFYQATLRMKIIEAKLGFIQAIGMTTHLAQTRSNGLLSMVKQMKNYALAYKLKNEMNDYGNGSVEAKSN